MPAEINAMFSQLEEDISARVKNCRTLTGQARFDKASEEYKLAFASKEEIQRIFACEWSSKSVIFTFQLLQREEQLKIFLEMNHTR